MSASPLYLRSAGLSDDWRPIDRLLHRWVRAHGGDEALARLAGAISAAESDGHSALSADLFDGIDWGSDRVLAATRARIAARRLACAELAPLPDLDTPDDYRAALAAGWIAA